MKTNFLKTISLGMMAALMFFAVGCSKEQVEENISNVQEDVSPEQRAVIPLYVFAMANNTASPLFSVQKGCNSCYGQLVNGGAVWMDRVGSATLPTTVGVKGNCELDGSKCVFDKGDAFGTPGSWSQWYYVTPNQGGTSTTRKVLKVRFQYGVTVDNYNQFLYNVSTNTWNVSVGSGIQFSIINNSAKPTSCC
jgi:hypothetical protein